MTHRLLRRSHCGHRDRDEPLLLTRYYSPLEVDLALVRWSTGREFGLEFISMEAGEWKRIRQFVKTLEPSRVTSEIL